jgi:hypothetical protein
MIAHYGAAMCVMKDGNALGSTATLNVDALLAFHFVEVKQ